MTQNKINQDDLKKIREFYGKAINDKVITKTYLVNEMGLSNPTIDNIINLDKKISDDTARVVFQALDKVTQTVQGKMKLQDKAKEKLQAKEKPTIEESSPVAPAKKFEITDEELEVYLEPLKNRNFAITRDNEGDVLRVQSGQSDVYGGTLNLVVANQKQKVEKFITLERMVKGICKQGRF